MKIFKKFSTWTVLGLGVISPVAIAASCSNDKGSEETQKPILPSFNENNVFDYSVIKIPNSEKYLIYFDEKKINEYVNFDSQKINDSKQRSQYIASRRAEYVSAWRNALQEYKKQLEVKVNKELSSAISFSNLNNFSLKSEQIQNLPSELSVDFLGKQFKLKLVGSSHTLNFPNYLKQGLESNLVKEYISEVQNKSSFPIELKASYSLSLNNQDINDFSITIVKEAETTLEKTLGDTYNNLEINLADLPKVNVDWNAKEISQTYVDGYIAAPADGDTYTIKVTNSHNHPQIKTGESIKVRLAGIDTPEKAVSDIQASAFEQSFALISTQFASRLMKTKLSNGVEIGKKLRVGFASSSDAYSRRLGDVFFGENFEYSYNLSIVSQGYTLPYISSKAGWINNLRTLNTYENVLYPHMYKAFNAAISNKKGFFAYFNSPVDVQKFVYLIKPNGEWLPFWSETPAEANAGNISNYVEIN